MDFPDVYAQTVIDSTLKVWIDSQFDCVQKSLAERDAKLARQTTELHATKLKIETLVMELAHLRRMRFGAKSEAINCLNGVLFGESMEADGAALAVEIDALASPTLPTPAGSTAQTHPAQAQLKAPRLGAGRQALPAHLPRVIHQHDLLDENGASGDSCACPACKDCGDPLTIISTDVSETLDIIPAQFFVHQHHRPQYACRSCETVVAAPVAPAIIDGGMCAPGLLSWVLTSKFVDHLPLYRLEQIAERSGVRLSRSTLAEWVGRTGVALAPLVDRLRDKLRARTVLHADETPVQQLAPGNGKTQRAYLWAYCTSELQAQAEVAEVAEAAKAADFTPAPAAFPIVVFDYQAGRAGSHARAFLDGWSGHLMVDDYVGYKALFAGVGNTPPSVIELGCMAHARRKFFDLHVANASPVAAQALRRIGELYALEAHATDQRCSSSARQRLREAEAIPKLNAMKAWLTDTRGKVANGTGLARAIDYSLRRFPALSRYACRGDLPIDNNAVENAIRPIAIGKKNWLFAGSARAGVRAAAIQSLVATAKRNHLDPAAWLTDVLTKLPAWPNSRIDELLPFANYRFG